MKWLALIPAFLVGWYMGGRLRANTEHDIWMIKNVCIPICGGPGQVIIANENCKCNMGWWNETRFWKELEKKK